MQITHVLKPATVRNCADIAERIKRARVDGITWLECDALLLRAQKTLTTVVNSHDRLVGKSPKPKRRKKEPKA